MAKNSQQENLEQAQSYVESLKEVLGVRTRLTESEQYSLNLARQITKAISDQKTGLSDINTVQKQTKKQIIVKRSKKAKKKVVIHEVMFKLINKLCY